MANVWQENKFKHHQTQDQIIVWDHCIPSYSIVHYEWLLIAHVMGKLS